MKRKLIALALATATISAPAFAATDKFEMAIDYNVSAFENADLIEAEYQHIRDQVVETCTAEHSDIHFGADFFVKSCTRTMMKKVVAKIDNDALTTLYSETKNR